MRWPASAAALILAVIAFGPPASVAQTATDSAVAAFQTATDSADSASQTATDSAGSPSQTATDSAGSAQESEAQASEVQQTSPLSAQTGEDFVRSPNDAPLPPLPPAQERLLEKSIPSLREALSRLPPFFRDMDVNLRLRSLYFNRQNENTPASEAWTLGGW